MIAINVKIPKDSSQLTISEKYDRDQCLSMFVVIMSVISVVTFLVWCGTRIKPDKACFENNIHSSKSIENYDSSKRWRDR